MTDKEIEGNIRELHERSINESMKRIAKSIGSSQEFVVHDTPEGQKNIHSVPPEVQETTVSPQQEHSGPEKIVEIRNEVAATQSPAVLNSDKQHELMEIVKQQSESFEKALRRKVSANRTRLASQHFKDELMKNVHRLLTEG